MGQSRHVFRSCRGFTLLELILAMLLMGALLAATWMLMGIFQGRLERSQQQTEQSQLIRALQRTLENDLRSCQRPAGPARDEADTLSRSASAVTDSSAAGGAIDAGDGRASSESDRSDAAEFSDPFQSPRESNPTTNFLDEPNADMRASLQPLTAALGTSPSLSADADRIVRREWLTAESFLLGNSQALMLDRVPAALPGMRSPPALQPSAELAAIPDVVRRVVYVFSDAATALRTDRPPGLIRCELTMGRLTELRGMMASDVDLVGLLRSELPQVGPDPPVAPAANAALGAESTVPLSGSIASDDALANPSRNLTATGDVETVTTAGPLAEHLDYLPEVATFRLRYYDNGGWQDEWDSRQQGGRLPVAIEMRFQLAAELPAPDASPDTEPGVPGETPRATASLETAMPAEPLEPGDDSLRSAQTRPPQDHRYVILVSSPPPNRSSAPLGPDAPDPSEPPVEVTP